MCYIVLVIHPAMSIFNDLFEETKNSFNSYQLRIARSSQSQMFFKIGVLGVLGLKACKFIKKRLQHRCFAMKFAKFLVLHRHLPHFCNSYICLLNKQCAGDKKPWNEIQFLTDTGVRNSLQVLDLLRSSKLHVSILFIVLSFDAGE